MFEFKSLKLSGIKGAQNIGTDKETKKRVWFSIYDYVDKGHEPRSIHFRLSLLKKVGSGCGLLCLLGAGVLFQSSHILYKAHQDQQELLTYRSEKAVQEQKIGQLLQENEAIEKEMAELSKL